MMRNVGMSMGEKHLEGSLMKDLSWISKKISNYRNLIFIVLIWIVIGLHSYYDYISALEHYNWAVDYGGNTPNSTERVWRDDIMEPGKLSIAFRGCMWGLFFTGYFLNAHAKLKNSQ